jgi:hypothetical protein
MNSFLSSISNIILRDLDSLEREIALNPTTDSIWVVKGEVKNSAGNLALHLCGNLQHYIGAVLGQTGYVRDRPKEFSLKGISAKDLVLEIIRTKEAIRFTFPKIDPTTLEKEYPEKVFADPMTTEYFLIHLSTHLGYHLGQVNYHRRLV